jgi:hypothetical protein
MQWNQPIPITDFKFREIMHLIFMRHFSAQTVRSTSAGGQAVMMCYLFLRYIDICVLVPCVSDYTLPTLLFLSTKFSCHRRIHW